MCFWPEKHVPCEACRLSSGSTAGRARTVGGPLSRSTSLVSLLDLFLDFLAELVVI